MPQGIETLENLFPRIVGHTRTVIADCQDYMPVGRLHGDFHTAACGREIDGVFQ
jgi:hypothetical protein